MDKSFATTDQLQRQLRSNYKRVRNNIYFSCSLAVTRLEIHWTHITTRFWDGQLGHQGQQGSSTRSIIILIAATYSKAQYKGGLSWVSESTGTGVQDQQGVLCCEQFHIFLESTTCLRALALAQAQGNMYVQIYTASRHLVRLLQSSTLQDLHVRWTLTCIREMGSQLTSCQIMRATNERVTKARLLATWCCQHRMNF